MKKYFILLTIIVVLMSGCTQNIEIANTNVEIEVSPSQDQKIYQQDWLSLEDGIDFKEVPIYSESTKNELLLDVVTVFKFNPDYFNFELQQSTTEPLTISQWQEAYQPLFVTNGSYFAQDYLPSSLVKINGIQYGNNLSADSVGELVIDDNNPKIFVDTDISKYNNILQSYPLLVAPEKHYIETDSGQTAPRTVVAKDNDGNILFIYTQSYYFSLYKLQNWLNESDLNLKIALNLDGGPSSGYYYNGDTKKITESAEVPNVIMIYRDK